MNKVIAAIFILLLTVQVFAAKLDKGRVDRAINGGLRYLRTTQQPSGAWRFHGADYDVGATGLAVSAISLSGAGEDDRSIAGGVGFLISNNPARRKTYQYSIKIIALYEVNPKKYYPQIEMSARWLESAQLANGRWDYEKPHFNSKSSGDNSNTQFAVLGLHIAEKAGVKISSTVLPRTEKMLLATQHGDGGWGYRSEAGSRVSMTAAGIASLYVAGHELFIGTNICGEYKINRNLGRAFTYLTRNRRRWNETSSHLFYTLYAIERVGVFSSQRTIGKYDWFVEGAQLLLSKQKSNGSWAGNPVDTAFALLFLLKGKAPLLINKLRWNGKWNNTIHDVKNLTRYYAQLTGEPVDWQAIDIKAPVSQMLKAPVLFLNGNTKVSFTKDEMKKLRDYVRNGGTIWAETCCGEEDFDRSFRKLVEELYPRQSLKLLSSDHPIYHSFYDIDEKPFIYGVNVGCRIGIIYHKRNLSVMWERKHYNSVAYQTGMNILRFVLGDRRLVDRLAQIDPLKDSAPPDILPGALTLAQIRHSGEWETDPNSLDNLAGYLRTSVNMNVSTRKAVVAPSTDALYAYPIVYMTGHHQIIMTNDEIARFRTYLERGGFLLADACCGRIEFDISFREFAEKLYPDRKLEKIPLTDPLFSSAYKITSVAYKDAVLKREPGKTEPYLEGIRVGSRWAVVYSKYNLGCSWENHVCPNCIGIKRADALKVGANIIIYASSN